jgi:hypothetical protein
MVWVKTAAEKASLIYRAISEKPTLPYVTAHSRLVKVADISS